MINLFLVETSVKQQACHRVNERYIGCIGCIVGDHIEDPGKLGTLVAVQRVVWSEGGLHTT